MSLGERWRAEVRHELEAAISLRHTLHAEPRVSGDEADTCELVVEALGLDKGRPIATTGRLVEVSAGTDPSARAVVLRTELDALPVVERTNAPWSALNGAMHACGHDVHMAGLVAVARAAARLELPAPLVALLQPREEGAESGARDVVAEGGLHGVDSVVAAHVQPQLPPHQVSSAGGAVNAATDEFTVTVTGRGGATRHPPTGAGPGAARPSLLG